MINTVFSILFLKLKKKKKMIKEKVYFYLTK